MACGGMDPLRSTELKLQLKRIVAMLTKMAMKFDGVSESSSGYDVHLDHEHEHEHREAEHEHEEIPEIETARTRIRPPVRGWRSAYPRLHSVTASRSMPDLKWKAKK